MSGQMSCSVEVPVTAKHTWENSFPSSRVDNELSLDFITKCASSISVLKNRREGS